MGIRVKCPNGHEFKVKDKYAGKKGLCPHCTDQTVVMVPDLLSTATDTVEHQKEAERAAAVPDTSGSSIFDDPLDPPSASSSGSLLSGSFIEHRTKCHKCGAKAPMWYAKCPSCGTFLEHE